jgi:DNA-binding NarL/FixJ family response regulator
LLVGAIQTHADRYRADDDALIEALHALMAVCSLGGGRPDLWAPFHDSLARLQPRPPDVLALCATVFADPARTTAADLAALDEIIAGLHDELDSVQIVRVGIASFSVDRAGAMRQALWRVVEDGRRGGVVASAIGALQQLCFDAVHSGRWAEVDALAHEALALCESRGYGLRKWPLHIANAVVAASRGEYQTTRDLAEQLMRWAAPRGLLMVHRYCSHALALAALAGGDNEEAYRQAATISPPGEFASHIPVALWAAMDLVEAAVLTGRRDEAAAHVEAMRQANLAALSPRLALLVGGSMAMTAPDREAADLFEQTLASPGVSRWPFDLARVQLAYGEHLRRVGANGGASSQLTAALAGFEELGARPWAARAERHLHVVGSTAPRGQLVSAALTKQQLEIAQLAATGLTNKEIGQRLYLSHRTVGAQLYRIYPKLGVKSRAGLADALRELDSPPWLAHSQP